MDVPDVPHLHSLTDWSPDGRRGVENVKGIHLSECRVNIRAHQKNQVFRWQCIKPMRIQAPQQLGLGARALARVNNHQLLEPDQSGTVDNSGMAIRNACASQFYRTTPVLGDLPQGASSDRHQYPTTGPTARQGVEHCSSGNGLKQMI